MSVRVILNETAVFAALFTAIVFLASRGDRKHSPTAIHNHPPDIQEEYFKTHERVEADAALGYRTNCLCFILLRESARHDKLYIREVLCLQELEIIHHGQIDGISLFFDTVDYRTPHFHSEWELIWVAEGRLSIRCGADICAGQKGELFLFGPGTIHEFQKMEESATFLCLQMSPQIFETIYPGFLRMIIEDFRVNQYLGREDCSRLQRDIMELMAAYLEQAPFYELLCLGSCAQILHRLLQAMPYHRMSAEELSTADKRNARLTRFIRFVDENYTQNIRLSDFAKAEGCSVSYISRFIKSSLNQNFQEYVNSVRYYSACKLIAAGGMKMLDVCEESGFSDYRYFSDAFKRRSGMTPEEYNRQAAKPEDRNTHHSLHSMERFYTREESLALLKKLRS